MQLIFQRKVRATFIWQSSRLPNLFVAQHSFFSSLPPLPPSTTPSSSGFSVDATLQSSLTRFFEDNHNLHLNLTEAIRKLSLPDSNQKKNINLSFENKLQENLIQYFVPKKENLWSWMRTVFLGLMGVAASWFIEAAFKERSEKLALLASIRSQVYDQRTEAQKKLSELSWVNLEIAPRLGMYTHVIEEDIQGEGERKQKLLTYLQSTQFLRKRLQLFENTDRKTFPKIWDTVQDLWKILIWIFMQEVRTQATLLTTELKVQHFELKIAYNISSALLHLKLKQCDQALTEANSVLKDLDRLTVLQPSSNCNLKSIFRHQARLNARLIQGRACYINAICFQLKDQLLHSEFNFALAANETCHPPTKPLALCYLVYALTEQRKFKDAILKSRECIALAPELANAYDCYGYSLHLWYRELRTIKTEEEKKFLEIYDQVLDALKLKGLKFSELAEKVSELAMNEFNKGLLLMGKCRPVILSHRGWMLMDLGKYKEALRDFDDALSLFESSDDPRSRAGRGLATKKLHGNTTTSKEDINISYIFYRNWINLSSYSNADTAPSPSSSHSHIPISADSIPTSSSSCCSSCGGSSSSSSSPCSCACSGLSPASPATSQEEEGKEKKLNKVVVASSPSSPFSSSPFSSSKIPPGVELVLEYLNNSKKKTIFEYFSSLKTPDPKFLLRVKQLQVKKNKE